MSKMIHVSGPKYRCLTWNATTQDQDHRSSSTTNDDGGADVDAARKTTPRHVDIPGIPWKVVQYAPTVYGGITTVYQPGVDCQGYFVSSTFMSNNNCYNYACNIASNSNAQPGRRHGFTNTEPFHTKEMASRIVRHLSEMDGLVVVGTTLQDVKNHAKRGEKGHYCYAAVLVVPEDRTIPIKRFKVVAQPPCCGSKFVIVKTVDDYFRGNVHFVRCDDPIEFKKWSQKNGDDQITNFDFAGQPIQDPSKANWEENGTTSGLFGDDDTLDGFSGVFNASAEARFRAMDELVEAGKPVTKENLKPIADKYYNQMFGSDGMLSDEAVKFATGEMALNLDTPLASSVTDLTKTVPALKPFLMFPTTGMNMIDIGGKYNPIFTPFQRDINELAYTPLNDLFGNEARIDELLRARNINPDTMDTIAKQNRIADLKYTTRGRKAMGAMAVTSAIGLLMNGRLTGDGLMDREAQRSREKQSSWKKRSIIGPDGKYYSYEWLGPLADWVAFVANVGDNFDMLGQAQTERFFEKAMFILGASVTDRTGLSTLKPLMDMLSGNPGAGQRWAAGFTNSLGPLAGQRGEWSRVFSEGLMETNDDFL